MTFRIRLFAGLCLFLISCKNSNDQSNRLIHAGSPYLREHADNPVDWYEWGPEALEKAKKENKPLIVSIGYSSCHWCHVMERESFMDTTVARIMNENFVSVKIDREERPDIDQIYLNAAQLISGHAGWPLNAFALPDGRPFYAATYFTKDQWIKILGQIVEVYKNENANVVKQADNLTKGIQMDEMIATPKDTSGNFSQNFYLDFFNKWLPLFDESYGGLKGSPKFPMPVIWESLLQYYYLTGNKKALEIVTTTLDNMAMGGIYDQLGGGFSRYSVDSQWEVPHFEKMLYDNAQLVSLYAHAFQVTKNPLYRKVAEETLAFAENELTSPEGGFYSSINADSEGEEGKYYTWTRTDAGKILNQKTSQLIFDFYGITDSGNWESKKNILYTKWSADDFAASHNISENEWQRILTDEKNLLKEERNKRVRPSTDNKILTSWNALMINAFSDAYAATGSSRYLEVALKNARFLETKMMRNDGHLWRSYIDGKATIDAFLDDYALLAKTFIQLYQITFDLHWLEQARVLTDYVVMHFRNRDNALFFYTSDTSESLVARKMEVSDNVIPSSNAVLANVLYRLGNYYQNEVYIELSKKMVSQVHDHLETSGVFHANWAGLFGAIAFGHYEIVVCGDEAVEKNIRLQSYYNPVSIFMGGKRESLPLMEYKLIPGKTMIYVCRNRICKLPTDDVEIAKQQARFTPGEGPI